MAKHCLRQPRPWTPRVRRPCGGVPFFRAWAWPESLSPSQLQTSLTWCERLGGGSFSGVSAGTPSARGSSGPSLMRKLEDGNRSSNMEAEKD